MVVEALAARGHADAVHGWLDRYRTRLEEFPAAVADVTADNWREALGDPRRVAALAHGDEHVIKLTDTALDVGDDRALAAALRSVELSTPLA
ncbi:hypothetical protein [Streptomyces sp. NBC_00289]|uniref:hypothetical protein n=1 Tax=Streptomyces sp. NBC_00289 TaxID=2975703 RepID=UPI00352C39B2